jgi:lysophospholipase L1-like esterase
VTSETACKVVFAFGANDTTVEDGDLRVPSNRSRDALGALLEQADKLGLRAFVVGPAPVDDEEQNERIAALSNSFSALCADCNVPFVDVVGTLRRHSSAWRREVVEGDGAHPGAGGYEELAGLVIDGGWMDWVER